MPEIMKAGPDSRSLFANSKKYGKTIDGIFDVLERESLRIPKNTQDGFQRKIQFPGGRFRIRNPLLYPY